MNFDWKFSEEVQSELNNFLEIIERNKKNKSDIIVIEDENVNNSKITDVTKHLNNSSIDVSNIIVIEDDSKCENETSHVTEQLNEVSFESKSQAPINMSKEIILNEYVHEFINYLKIHEETQLENELLEQKIFNEFDDCTLNYLFSNLHETSECKLDSINRLICAHPEKQNIVHLFCKLSLLPKVKKGEFSQRLRETFSIFTEKFPVIVRTELLFPLLQENFDHSKWCLVIINKLPELEKQNLLRDFVFLRKELELWHLSVLQSLIAAQTVNTVKKVLIDLISQISYKFSNEKLLLNFLITLIQYLDESFLNQEDLLLNIISRNKTVLKISAQKVVKKWIANCNKNKSIY